MYMTVEEYGKLSEKLSAAGFELVKISGDISRQRQLKEKKEIQAVQEAEALGDRAFSYILDKIKPGAVEREIALDLEFYMRRNGAGVWSSRRFARLGRGLRCRTGRQAARRLRRAIL